MKFKVTKTIEEDPVICQMVIADFPYAEAILLSKNSLYDCQIVTAGHIENSLYRAKETGISEEEFFKALFEHCWNKRLLLIDVHVNYVERLAKFAHHTSTFISTYKNTGEPNRALMLIDRKKVIPA